MGEFGEGKGDQAREDWQKYPVAMRFQRLEMLADLSVRLRAYTFGGVESLSLLENIATTKNLLGEVRGDEVYAPIGVREVLERYEALVESMGHRTPEIEKMTETTLRSIAEIIDKEYTGVLIAAKTASDGDLRDTDMLAVADVPKAARRDLHHLKEIINERPSGLSHFSWQLELKRQRLVADGLRYERAHPEEKGETAKANVAWLTLEDALLAPERDEMDEGTKNEMLERIEACEELVDLVEGWEE